MTKPVPASEPVPVPAARPSAPGNLVRILSLPTEALIRLVAPRHENVVWDMLLRQQRRGALRWPVMPTLMALAVAAPVAHVVAGAGSPWPVYLMIGLMGAIVMIFTSILRPPTQVQVRCRKTGCADHLLSAPIASRDFADAFLRSFVLAAVETAVVIACLPAALILSGEGVAFGADAAWFLTGLAGLAWIIYWVAIRGGIVQLLPLAYLIAFLQAVRGMASSGWGDFLIVFMKFSVVLFWIGGFAIYLWCRRDYADLLRRRLFP